MFSRVILLLLACVGLTAGAPAQTMMHVPPPRTISVTGTAERQVPPDLAFAAVAVETQARTVAEAAAQNTAAARRIIDAIQALNLPNLTVRTLTFDVQPVYEQQRPGVTTPPRITGYRVINRVQARLPDADADRLAANVGRVLDAALQAGANRVDQVAFDLQDEQRALREIVADATRNARETALALAAAAGVQLGALQTLSTAPVYRPLMAQARAVELAAAPGVPIVAGPLTVTATVSAVYLIQ